MNSPGGARVNKMTTAQFFGLLLFVIAGYTAVELGKLMCEGKLLAAPEPDREFILTISQPETPGFDVVQSGLDKAEAEGVAFQLNEIFKRRGIPVSVKAQSQIDIGRYHPKP